MSDSRNSFPEVVHVQIADSTISANMSNGVAGIYLSDVTATIRDSTVSSNRWVSRLGSNDGERARGGIFLERGDLDVVHSTVTENFGLGTGNGIASRGNLQVDHSIVAGNLDRVNSPVPHADLVATGALSAVRWSLIGTGGTFSDDGGNLTGTAEIPLDPLLGPLANNGGPTKTHALLPGSPAIDAGDPSIQFDENEFDQRGPEFLRVADGDIARDIAIDIGAYESQGIPNFPVGDFNHDGIASAADYVLWRNTQGDEVEPFSGADTNGNGVIGDEDYAIWRANFGNTDTILQFDGGGAGATGPPTAEASATDNAPLVAPGVSTSATLEDAPILLSASPTPRIVDAALLELLGERNGRRDPVDHAIDALIHESSEIGDELFAALAVDVRVQV